jgi:dTDP-4-dehydrorhamnose 3,5-epimerase
MKFIPTKLNDAFVIDLEKRGDDRGFFARTFCVSEFEKHGLKTAYPQCNMSLSKDQFTLRGFHFQIDGAEEAKLVRCIKGSILDVIIDIRKDSSTYGEHIGVELTADNYRALYVPEGFAHSFITLEPDTEVFYMVSAMYSPGKERGIRWNDPAFNVQWPTSNPMLSEKDANWPDFEL